MKGRCCNPNDPAYKNYGRRGIKVCNEWKNDFNAYCIYIMSLPNALMLGLLIDRIDNDGNYEPGNIRWVNDHFSTINRGINSNNKTGYKGVIFNKVYKKYMAYIRVNNEQIYLGIYSNIKDAVMARNRYIIKNKLFEYPLQDC